MQARIDDRPESIAAGRLVRLRSAVEHAAHLLPRQGPIGVFVHHNTLHAFEDLPFEQAVIEASHLFGAEPYMAKPPTGRSWRAAASSSWISTRFWTANPMPSFSQALAGARFAGP